GRDDRPRPSGTGDVERGPRRAARAARRVRRADDGAAPPRGSSTLTAAPAPPSEDLQGRRRAHGSDTRGPPPADDTPRARERAGLTDLLGIVHPGDRLGVVVQGPDAKDLAVRSASANVAKIRDRDLLRRAQAGNVF